MVLEQFNNSVKLVDGRYTVHWPWKPNSCLLPTNYQLALGRLKSLGKRLRESDGSLPVDYNNVIQNQLKLGVIEEVPCDEVELSNNLVHYLPHHPVVKVDHTTTKVRIVYDASAKCRKNQVSLNECLYRGPVILPDLCSILLRFRFHPVAIISDIEKAFLQVSLDPTQRDVTRFIWFRDPQELNVNNIVVYRFTRVPFGIICSQFMLSGSIQCHVKQYKTDTANHIRDDSYVDNVITGAENVTKGITFYNEAKTIFADASMNLREWSSNSTELMSHIPAEDRCSKETTKVLGLKWSTRCDTIQLNASWAKHLSCSTKRSVLKAVASVYDPLGLFQPCTVRLKMFLRELKKSKTGWDECVDEKLQSKWDVLHEKTSPIFEFAIDRHVSIREEFNLVVFTDASAEAYAVAVYLRSRYREMDTWATHLIYSKSRLAPKAKPKTKAEDASVSIPKLELLGLTIGARAANFVRKSMANAEETKVYLLSDSLVALSWLQSAKTLPVFISNRVKEIKLLKNAEFRHVDGDQNPADMCTRGVPGQQLKQSTLWWHGPSWLQHDVTEWSTKSSFQPITDAELRKIELKPNSPVYHSLLAGEGADGRTNSFPLQIDPTRYSSFSRLIRVTCWCLKFLKRLFGEVLNYQPKLRRVFSVVNQELIITVDELSVAEQLWIRCIQIDNYYDVLQALETNDKHNLVSQLNLHIDENGLIRSTGRFTFADLPENVVQPLLLPYNDPVTSIIISDVHRRLLHSGINHTLSQVRQRYWVPRGRNAVRKVVTRCQLCRRNNGYPFARPVMPPWPRERVCRSNPFQFTGVDYVGPINVGTSEGPQKMWVALFTCLAVRAVHLEPVLDCSAESFANCISRFIARRGAPEQILSDNAPQFRLLKTLFDRSWHNIFRDDTVQTYISQKGVKWKFIIELSPWMGGVYERMVALVKNTFKSTVGRKLLKYEEFVTLLAETESIVNSRPITFVYSDIRSGTPLRPMDFLTNMSVGTPAIDATLRPEGGEASRNLIRMWKNKQKRLDVMWERWYNDYLLSMRERGGMTHKKGRSDIKSSVPIVNEVVIVKNEGVPRGTWKLGRITKVIAGQDGNIRSAELILPNKQVIRRPVSHLYRLEIPTIVNETSHDEPIAGDMSDAEPFDGFTEEEAEEARLRTMGFLVCARSTDGLRLSRESVRDRIFPGLSM